jgi:hypothetical protein
MNIELIFVSGLSALMWLTLLKRKNIYTLSVQLALHSSVVVWNTRILKKKKRRPIDIFVGKYKIMGFFPVAKSQSKTNISLYKDLMMAHIRHSKFPLAR